MTRLGMVAIGSRVHAVAVRRGRAVWTAEQELDAPADMPQALGHLLGEAPSCRSAVVALGAPWCQVRVLAGFPPMSDRRLRRAIALEPGRWFLRGEHPLLTGAWRRKADVVAVAIASDAVQAVAQVFHHVDRELIGITAAGIAAAGALPDGWHALDRSRIAVRRGDLCASQRNGTQPAAVESVVHAAALGAARCRVRALAPPSTAERRRLLRRRVARRMVALAAGVWMLAIGVGCWRLDGAVSERERALVLLQQEVAPALATEREVHRLAATAATLHRVAQARSTDGVLLARLGAGLPATTRVVSLQRSTADQVRLDVLAPAGGGVPAAVARIPGVDSVRVEGATASGGPGLERFAIVFRWNGT